MNYSEKGFGARVENARKILEQLKTFGDYAPPVNELSIDNFEKQIKLTENYNENTTDAAADYAKAVDAREKLFRKEPESFTKRMPSVKAAVRSIYGRKSQELEAIMVLARKATATKLKKPAKNPDETNVSQSELSYGSLTKVLSDIIITLERHGSTYNPANPDIQLTGLKTLQANIEQANKTVTNTLVIQRNTRQLRADNYATLHDIAQRIKDAVKSQYTTSSTEYKLIKNIVA